MNIGMIAAMECELKEIIESLDEKHTQTLSMYEFVVGHTHDHTVVAVCSGIGLVNAALATTIMMHHFALDCVMNPGVAGALSEELNAVA